MKDDIKNLKFLSDRRFLKKSNTINVTTAKNYINNINTNDTSHYVVKNPLYNKNYMIIYVLYFIYIFELMSSSY
jgi:hypothetical protein